MLLLHPYSDENLFYLFVIHKLYNHLLYILNNLIAGVKQGSGVNRVF